MFPIKFAYMILSLLLSIIWIAMFVYRRDTRKEMLILSIAFGIGGLLAESVYLKDWWQPITITHTPIGIEDFLFGFTIGGIASVIYEIIFKKRTIKKSFEPLNKKYITNSGVILLLPILFFGGSIYLGLNTFYSSLLGYGIPLLIMYIKRKDLILNSIISGILLLSIIFIIYTLVEILSPGWVMHFWTFKNVPPVVFWNVPIDDLIWYIFTGAFIGIMYEFIQESPILKFKK